jgi:hypothetical protein
MALNHEENFRLADGSSWPSTYWTVFANGGTCDVQNQQGRMVVSTAGAYFEVDAQFQTALANFEALVSVKIEPVIGESYIGIQYRQDGSGNYYRALIEPSFDAIIVEKYTGFSPTLMSNPAFPIDANDIVHMRLIADGSSHKFRCWKNQENEPSTWNVDVTEATWNANTLNTMICMNGAAQNAATALWQKARYGPVGSASVAPNASRATKGRALGLR